MSVLISNIFRAGETRNTTLMAKPFFEKEMKIVWPASWGDQRQCPLRPWRWCRCCNWVQGPWSAGPRGLCAPRWDRWRAVYFPISWARAAWTRAGWVCGVPVAGPPPDPARTPTLRESSPTTRPRATLAPQSSSPHRWFLLLHCHFVTPLFLRYRCLDTALRRLCSFHDATHRCSTHSISHTHIFQSVSVWPTTQRGDEVRRLVAVSVSLSETITIRCCFSCFPLPLPIYV